MGPEKIAKSHLVKLTRMQEDIVRASKDIDALGVAYRRLASAYELEIRDAPPFSSVVPGRDQARRCTEILSAHVELQADIDRALDSGTDGKQVAALQLRLDALEDERDALDEDLRAAQRRQAMRVYLVQPAVGC